VVKRLEGFKGLWRDNRSKWLEVSKGFYGKAYDLYFSWSDEEIYCSELVYKIYERAAGIKLGNLQTLGSFDLTHPAVKTKLRERYGKNVPEDESVISPATIFADTRLITIESN